MHAAIAATPACHAISFEATLNAGDAYSRDIGGGLALRLIPQIYSDPGDRGKRLDGWHIVVVTAHPTGDVPPPDRIWPANLPLRFNPWQDIGTTYGISAADKLGRDIAYRFVWREAEYDKIAALASDALWPYSVPDPNKAGARYLDALERLDAAMIRLHPMHYDLSENGMSIRRLTLAIEVEAPNDFAFPASLAPAPCRPDPG